MSTEIEASCEVEGCLSKGALMVVEEAKVVENVEIIAQHAPLGELCVRIGRRRHVCGLIRGASDL